MNAYLDASVILRVVLEQPGAFTKATDYPVIVCSELLRVEVLRVLDRLQVKGQLTGADLAHRLEFFHRLAGVFRYVPIAPAVLARAAGHFPTPLGTLDAIHLATALLWMEERGEPLTLLTHDAELALAARASGLEVRTGP